MALRASGAETETANVPDCVGRVRVGVPAAAWGVIRAVPDPDPARASVPNTDPGIPSTGFEVKDGTALTALGFPSTVPPVNAPRLGCRLP
jgi:hypothetical protein